MYRSCLPLLVLTATSLTFAQDATTQSPTSPTKQSVKPGINEKFLDPELDVQEWIERFEVESREVYQARNDILRQLDLQPGMRFADIGEGTGFFTLLMNKAVGPEGWAYAVEISPRFTEHLVKQFDQRGIDNVTTVMCDDDSVCLPPDSIDLAFICDVYHHFEYPIDTMRSIQHALADGGRLVVIDFERIPGVSREWMLGHVRAGKQVFIDEIQSAGFEFVVERPIPGFKENYLLEFRKVDQP